MASNKRQASEGKIKFLQTYLPNKTTLVKPCLIPPILTKQPTYLAILTPNLILLTAMDTGGATASSSKRNTRLDISKQYDARVAATTEKVDPFRAKANAALKNVDYEVEPLSGQWGADTVPQAPAAMNPEDAPLLTLRQLMPGSTGSQEEDRELDNAFWADRIEFILVQRPLTSDEANVGGQIEDAADVDWTIPSKEEYEDAMGLVFHIFTDERPELVHRFSWSSVGTNTGVGCFSAKTGQLQDIEDIRGTIRTIMHDNLCYETFPKKAIMKSYALTAFFPRSTKFVPTGKLIIWLLSCNPGLKGKIWPVEARKYPDTHPIARRRGARILSFTGDQAFLDSLRNFPPNFPFSIKLANVYIRGGDRAATQGKTEKRRRPRMTEEGLKKLLERHGQEMVEEAEEEDIRRAEGKTDENNN